MWRPSDLEEGDDVKGDVRDPGLAPDGRDRIEWAAKEMPVLALATRSADDVPGSVGWDIFPLIVTFVRVALPRLFTRP